MRLRLRARVLVAALTCVGLVACGGVNRAGTKRQILNGLSGLGLQESTKTCVADSIDKFTDAELRKLNASNADKAVQKRFADALTQCGAQEAAALTTDTTAATSSATTVASGASTQPAAAASTASTASTASAASTASTASKSVVSVDTTADQAASSVPLFESDFEPVCRGVGIKRSAPYAATAGVVHPALGFLGKANALVTMAGTIPDDWTIQWSASGDALAKIELVACSERTVETFAKECTGYTTSDQDGERVAKFYDTTYTVTLRAAHSGDVVATTTVDAKAIDCPIVVTFAPGASTTNEYATDEAAVQTFLKPFVQP